MRIDSLKNSPDRSGRYWVTFDDGTKLGLYRQTVEDFGLYIGKELTEDEKEKLKEGFLKGYLTYENPNIEIPLEVFLKNYEIPICVKVEDFRRRGK
jgi:hypothetical protein